MTYDKARVLYETTFSSPDEICPHELPEECGFCAPWVARGGHGVMLRHSEEYALEGGGSMMIYNRGLDWCGAKTDIYHTLGEGVNELEIMAWVKLTEGSAPGMVNMAQETVSAASGKTSFGWWDDFCGERNYLSKYMLPAGVQKPADPALHWAYNIPEECIKDGWVLLRGKGTIDKPKISELYLYFEGGRTEGKSIDNEILVGKVVVLKA
jgi:hypothetical protein